MEYIQTKEYEKNQMIQMDSIQIVPSPAPADDAYKFSQNHFIHSNLNKFKLHSNSLQHKQMQLI